jgi:nucleotide-binding universal stress UspA family protein
MYRSFVMTTKKVLVPVADSEFSLHVLPHVTRLLDPDRYELVLLHVEPVPGPVMVEERVLVYADQETASQEAASKADLQPYVRSLEELGYRVTPVVSFGDPATEIEHFVAERDVDLVAMTTHGRTGWARVLLGSVAEHVLTHVDVPVLLYRSFPEDSGNGAIGK